MDENQTAMPKHAMPLPEREAPEELLARFAQCPAELRDWAEKAGYENLKERIESGNAIAAQAATTLTLVLAGMGGALAYAVRVFEPSPPPTVVASAALCVWLMLIAALLVLKCINLAEAPMLYNQPNRLLLPGHTLADVRAGELVGLQERIWQQIDRNNGRSAWLNACRNLAICSPVVFGAVALYCR